MDRVWQRITANLNRRIGWALLAGFLFGILWVFGMRVILAKEDHVHYHANFSLFVNGQEDKFDNFSFYEEVASCGGNDVDNPKIRVHLHDHKPHVVHVHDNAVTWGELFANLGYTLGNDVVKTDQGVFVDGQEGKKLTFILNGEIVPAVANRTIGDTDALLVNYSDEDAPALQAHYKTVPHDAAEFDKHADPAACSGAEPLTFTERLRRAAKP